MAEERQIMPTCFKELDVHCGKAYMRQVHRHGAHSCITLHDELHKYSAKYYTKYPYRKYITKWYTKNDTQSKYAIHYKMQHTTATSNTMSERTNRATISTNGGAAIFQPFSSGPNSYKSPPLVVLAYMKTAVR